MKTARRHSWSRLGPAVLATLLLALPAGAAKKTHAPKQPRASQGASGGEHASNAGSTFVPPSSVAPASEPADAAGSALPASEPTDAAASPAPTPTTTPAAASGSEYLVRPGDTLRIAVWKEPEMSGDVTVRPDGKVTVPLLGDVNAWLKTPRQLSAAIAEGLARFVEEPQVTVAILQANSARFFIIGQVAKPGVYPLAGQISVLQAIALSGGFTPYAKRNRLMLFRGVDGSDGVTQIDFEKLSSGDIRQNFVLQPGDTLVVP